MNGPSHPPDDNLARVLRLSREMLALADEGDRDRVDDGCGILFGVLRDMAYKLRALAEQERRSHGLGAKGDSSSTAGSRAARGWTEPIG